MQKIFEIVKSFGAVDVSGIDGTICAVFPYLPENITLGNISLYARGLDYHIWVKEAMSKACEKLKELYPNNYFTPFVDVSPYNEVAIAVACGLGVLGKNRLLITEKYGSYVFIAIISTDLPIPIKAKEVTHCIGCNLCQKKCPNGAILNDRIITEQCLSLITQKRADLTYEEIELVKNHNLIWGCDICQTVCPMNKNILTSNVAQLIPNLTLDDLDMSDKAFRKKYHDYAFAFRGIKPLKRNLQIKKEATV